MATFSPLRFSIYSRDLQQALLELSREYQMGIKLQGIAAKVAKLEHDAEFEAEKLDKYVEEVAARVPTAFSGARARIEGLSKNVGDVEALVTGVEAIGNGAPPLEEPKAEEKPTEAPANPTPPVVNLVPVAS